MAVGTFAVPDQAVQTTGTPYKLAIKNSIMVLERLGASFAPHEQASPDMTVRIDAGGLFVNGVLTEVAAQNTGTITAPASNDRIDRVVQDPLTGVVSVITGTEAASPSPPAISSGKRPLAQVLLHPATTAIDNTLITDERVFTPSVVWPADIQKNSYTYVTLGGSANAYTASPSPDWEAYDEGQQLRAKVNVTNTGASTINISSQGVVNIKKWQAGAKVALAAGDLIAGQVIDLFYDGTDVILLGAAVPALSHSANYLTSDVIIYSADWADGPYLSLPAGTYLVQGKILLYASYGDLGYKVTFTARLLNGSTIESMDEISLVKDDTGSVQLGAFITLATTTTVKIQARMADAQGYMRAKTVYNNNNANKASYLLATKIG